MNTSNGNVILTQDLSKSYKGVPALQGLNLQVPKNSIFGFLGPLHTNTLLSQGEDL